MECGCVNSYCNFETPEIEREEYPKARKDHMCCECFRTIKKGEEYQRISGKWGDMFQSFATCTGCARLRDAMFCCAAFGDLAESVQEELDVDITEEA